MHTIIIQDDDGTIAQKKVNELCDSGWLIFDAKVFGADYGRAEFVYILVQPQSLAKGIPSPAAE
jgi:hypothetical protein